MFLYIFLNHDVWRCCAVRLLVRAICTMLSNVGVVMMTLVSVFIIYHTLPYNNGHIGISCSKPEPDPASLVFPAEDSELQRSSDSKGNGSSNQALEAVL